MEKGLEIVEVVGEQRLDFETQDGSKIDGYNIYYTMVDLDARSLKGKLAVKKFLSTEIYNRLIATIGALELVGYKGNFVYNDKGKITGIVK